jgi:hypothetical protein
MEYLDSISPFVLAGIGSTVDTNKATADGTFAAVVRMAEKLKLPKDFKIFIQVRKLSIAGRGTPLSCVYRANANSGKTLHARPFPFEFWLS